MGTCIFIDSHRQGLDQHVFVSFGFLGFLKKKKKKSFSAFETKNYLFNLCIAL